MISGPSHYRTAEDLLGQLGGHLSPELAVAAAQVHAALALAAATHAGIPAPGLPSFPDPGDFPDFPGGAAPGR